MCILTGINAYRLVMTTILIRNKRCDPQNHLTWQNILQIFHIMGGLSVITKENKVTEEG
jgi:hypothetical protein